MKLSKLLAIFAWINVFALMWVQIYGPVPESRWQSITALLLFSLVALYASGIQGQEKKYGG